MSEFKKVRCTCSDGYTCRDLEDPNCCAHNCDYNDLVDALNALQAERDALRQVCAEAYQMAGAIDAPNEALDNLSAAANGDPIPHKTFLPIFGDHLAAHDAEVAAKAVSGFVEYLDPLARDRIDVRAAADQYAQLRAKAGA